MSRYSWSRPGKVCRDRANLSSDIVYQDRENSCRDRGLWVATELDVHRPTRATTRTIGAQRVRQAHRTHDNVLDNALDGLIGRATTCSTVPS